MWPTEVRDEPSGLLGRSRQKARPDPIHRPAVGKASGGTYLLRVSSDADRLMDIGLRDVGIECAVISEDGG